MHLESRLFPIGRSDGFVYVSAFNGLNGPFSDAREISRARAFVGRLHSPHLQDLLPLCTLPRPASQSEASYFRQAAQGQESLAASGKYAKSQTAEFLKTAKQYQYYAELALQDSFWLPSQVLATRNGKLLVGVLAKDDERQSTLGLLRLVDMEGGTVLLEERLNSGDPQKPRELAEFLGVDAEAQTALFRNVKQSAGKVEIQILQKALRPGLPTITEMLFPSLPVGKIQSCTGRWIAIVDELEKRPELWIFERGGTEATQKIPLPKWPRSLAVALDVPLAAVGCVGGPVIVANVQSGDVRKFNPHLGIKRDDWIDVTLSDDGRWLLSTASDQCVLTSLESGKSAPVSNLKRLEFKEGAIPEVDARTLIDPAITFIADRIVVAEGGEIRALPIPDVESDPCAIVSEVGRAGAIKPLKIKPKAPIEENLKASGLTRVIPELLNRHSPAVRLRTKPLGKSGWSLPDKRNAPPLGYTRLGGWPDIPSESSWPSWAGRPMSFLAQINLVEMHAVQPGLRLPLTGLLSFFVGCSDDTYDSDEDSRQRFMLDLELGNDRSRRDGWRVIYSPDTSALERVVYLNEPLPEIFPPCEIRAGIGGKELPDEQAVIYEQLGLKPAEQYAYNALLSQLQGDAEEAPENQLMGYPSLLQGHPPELACEMSVRGLDPLGALPQDEILQQEILVAATEWSLLLQLTSDEHANFIWGDGGQFYFYGKRKEMERGDFSSVWIYWEN